MTADLRADPSTRRPSKSLFVRTGLMALTGVLLTLGLFVALILPTQHRMLTSRLESMAQVVATSIDQITVTSIVVEDYSPVIEHCMKVVRERGFVRYIVITRKDGFSLVHTHDGWAYERDATRWQAGTEPTGSFVDNELVDEAVFGYSYPLRYSGIDWGWIHIGLSTEQYDRDLRETYVRMAAVGGVCLIAASLISLFFARRVSRPIRHLDQVSRVVTAGNLSARATVSTGDEIESLAASFNQMTASLQRTQEELEQRVDERTARLLQANNELRGEIETRRQAEDARYAAEAELEAQRTVTMRSDRLRSLGEMAAGIAHELNQPLMGVRGLAEHILIGQDRGWPLEPEELHSRMERVVEQADRMVHIIEHIRMFAREAGRPMQTAVDVNGVVDSAVDLLGAQFRSHGLELMCEHGRNLPKVLGNAYSLEEVLLNLLNNARDAVEEAVTDGSSATAARVWVSTAVGQVDGQDRVLIEVADTGTGIADDVLSRVFDPFFSTKDPNKGTGLGLAVSKSIVEEFGGQLHLASALGRGTRATIALPPADGQVATASPAAGVGS